MAEKHPSRFLLRPLLTEKGTRLKETGGRSDAGVEGGELRRKVLFEVARDANKASIRRAIEHLFGVKVHAVHVQRVRGKEKRVSRFVGRTNSWKKAIVTLAEGEKIEFFEGV